MQETKEESSGTQNTLSKDTLESLGDRITSHCDEMEKLGLVDYEMGVWEEEIVRSKETAVTSAYQNASSTDYIQCSLNALIFWPVMTMAMMMNLSGRGKGRTLLSFQGDRWLSEDRELYLRVTDALEKAIQLY